MKKNKIVLILLSILLIVSLSFLSFNVRADSGWDSDYDSGWDSGSSWDSDWGGSSWDSDWESSSSYRHRISSEQSKFLGFFIIMIFVIIVIVAVDNASKTQNSTPKAITNRISEEEIKKVITDFNKKEFLDKAYQIFIDVQNAWMEFDYESLRKLLSDELYNSYTSQLKALNALKQKNIMDDFNKIDIDISTFNYTDNILTIKVELIVSFFDFVINKNNQIIRGTDNRKLTNHYELTFISTVNKKDKQNRCPNCGATLENVISTTCPYCNSTIISNNYDWVMSKKQIKR